MMLSLRPVLLSAYVALLPATLFAQSAPGPGRAGLTITGPPAATRPATTDASLMAAHANQSMTIDALIGYVNDQPIFATDLFRGQIDEQLTQLGKSARTVTEFEKQARDLITTAVKNRVSEELLFSAANSSLSDQERQGLDVHIEQDRGKLIESFGGSAPAAEKALNAEGSSIAQAMADLKRQYIKQLYIQRHIDRNVEVTQQMARDEYDRTPKRWQQPAQVELYTITLPVSRWLREPASNGEAGPIMAHATDEQVRSAEVQALATAQEIDAKLKKGADFARLAEDYNSADPNVTNGGKWKPVERGTLADSKFEDYIFALPANSLAEPYLDHESDYRKSKVIVVKIGEKRLAKVTSFVEAQDQIMKELRDQQLTVLRQKEMDKLANGAAIEAIDRMLDVAINAAVSRYATVK